MWSHKYLLQQQSWEIFGEKYSAVKVRDILGEVLIRVHTAEVEGRRYLESSSHISTYFSCQGMRYLEKSRHTSTYCMRYLGRKGHTNT